MSAVKPLNKKASDNKAQRAKSADDSAQISKRISKKSTEKNSLQPAPYIQTKLSVSTPGDTHEQEADRVADEVVSRSAANNSSPSETVNPGNSQPEKTLGNPQSLQTKISRVPEESLAKTEDGASEFANESSVPETADTTTENENGVSAEIEQQIESLKGNGAPLSEAVRSEMESQFCHDFSSVCIHNDAAADALCKQLSARAFTVGSDIFFASGEYAPDTQEGKRLLAHELTHVVQQGRGVTRKIMRDDAPVTATTYTHRLGDIDTTPGQKKIKIKGLQVPTFKNRFYQNAVASQQVDGLLSWKRNEETGGEARDTNQISEWESNVREEADQKVTTKLSRAESTEVSGRTIYYFKYNDSKSYLIGTEQSIKERCRRPMWNQSGLPSRFQVDHQIEYQTGGADNIDNMWLLDGSINEQSGREIRQEIRTKVQAFVDHVQDKVASPPTDLNDARANYIVYFEPIRSGLGDYSAVTAKQQYFTRAHIQDGEHLRNIQPMTETEIRDSGFTEGSANRLTLFPRSDGGRRYVFLKDPGSENYRMDNDSIRAIRRQNFEINSITFDAISRQGSVSIKVPSQNLHERMPNLPPPANLDPIPILPMDGIAWGGRFDANELTRKIREAVPGFPGLSPLAITTVDIDDSGLLLEGIITPTLPLFGSSPINFALSGDRLSVYKTFSATDLSIPPPFQISACSLSLGISNRDFFATGTIGFGIENVGSGSVTATASAGFDSSTNLSLAGQFRFDEKLFGEGTTAEVRVAYANEAWSMGGTITIPEGKVPGIRSATINVDYSQTTGFSARGNAELSVPGVESGTIEITHNEEEGFVIGGQFNLAQGRGIRGGQISARVQEKPDGSGYAVTAHGEAQPDIPGINSNLIVDYNDGAFTAEVSADYSRGMLSGQIHAGVTNRTVNEDGTLAETASENNELVVFGDGELTIQIAPWLQGTAGVRFAPNGEITVIGEIGLPGNLEIFARQEINRSIFNIAVQAPIFPGIVAEIGGGLSATAGVGPGVIDQLVLRVEYNPAHEEDTHITGDAHLNIPANAGLRLNVRAGIGLGITGASATGGLDIGGTLGIEGAAEAGVHVDWTPTTGLDITAELAVHAQPSFTFDIGGYVSVRALGFEVYDNRWQFASYTFGSDYRFGIRLPIHYHEGEPFEISTDDIEFEVPDIDTNQLLSGLIDRIA